MEPRWSYPVPMAMQPTSPTLKAVAERAAPPERDAAVPDETAAKQSAAAGEDRRYQENGGEMH
jgi:hypothetical protein